MVQQSVTESKVPERGQANGSREKLTDFSRSEGFSRRQRRRQQQQRRQDKVKIQPIQQRLQRTPSGGRSLTSAKTNGKRPSRLREPLTPLGRETRDLLSLESSLLTTPGGTVKTRPIRGTPGELPKKRTEQRKARSRPMAPLLYGLRLLILGVGLGAIAGTLLSVLDPTTRITAGASHPASRFDSQQQVSGPTMAASALKLGQEITSLKIVVQQLAAQHPGLLPGAFFVNLDTGAYLDVNASMTFAAASMIKFPILIAFFQEVDAGKISLDEILTLQSGMIAGGSGEMQYKPVGTKVTALEAVSKMITISDNTATNMLIARLGGATVLNQRFRSWGLTTTTIHSPLPDLEGTNTTSPRDLANLMALVNQGELTSSGSRNRLLEIMRHTATDSLLPRGLEPGAKIAHKTGDIGSLVGDVGLIEMPNGKSYIGVAMVKRPYNDAHAQELIRQVSHLTYQQFRGF